MQQNLVDDVIRKSIHNSGKFIVRKSPVNPDENDKQIYTSSSSQKQITATSDPALSEKTKTRLSYYDNNYPDVLD